MNQSDRVFNNILWSVRDTGNKNPSEICIHFNKEERKYNIEEQPLDWLNWVKLYIDEENNSIGLNISNGDPHDSQINFYLKKYIREGEQITYEINVIEKSLSNAELIGSYNIDLNCLKIDKYIQAYNEKLKCELLDTQDKISELEEKNSFHLFRFMLFIYLIFLYRFFVI